MEKAGWKTLAIISLILLILAVIGLGLIFKAGADYEANRATCAYDICGLKQGEHDAFFYADADGSCFCFSKGELDFIEDVKK